MVWEVSAILVQQITFQILLCHLILARALVFSPSKPVRCVQSVAASLRLLSIFAQSGYDTTG